MTAKNVARSEEKRVKAFPIRLTRAELIHLRDLFSVYLSTGQTVSQSLACAESREDVEVVLWQKLVAACKSGDVPVDEQAPDYIVGVTGQPTMSVFQIDAEGSDIETQGRQVLEG